MGGLRAVPPPTVTTFFGSCFTSTTMLPLIGLTFCSIRELTKAATSWSRNVPIWPRRLTHAVGSSSRESGALWNALRGLRDSGRSIATNKRIEDLLPNSTVIPKVISDPYAHHFEFRMATEKVTQHRFVQVVEET